MTPLPTHLRNTIACADALEYLRQLPGQSIHCAVTSPPYYRLRQYLPGKVRLRSNLSAEVRQRVISELQELGIQPSEGESDAR